MKTRLLILVSVVAIGVMAIGVLGSGAWFSDQEISPGNSFTAGKLDLVLGAGAPLPFNVVNVVPGQSGVGKVTLTNAAGSIDGMLNINLANVVESENDMIEPETESVIGIDGHPTTGDYDGNGGELKFFLQYGVYVDVNKNGIFDTGDIQLAYDGQKSAYPGFWEGDFHYSGINGMVPGWNNVMTLTGGQSVDLVIMWQFPTESTDGNYSQNIAMTDGESFDAVFLLNQVH